MGLCVQNRLRFFLLLLAVSTAAASLPAAMAAELRAHQKIWVKKGRNVELLSTSGAGLYDAPPGIELQIVKPRVVRGKHVVAILQDAGGHQYSTLAENLRGTVTTDPTEAAVLMPSNVAEVSNQLLTGRASSCGAETQTRNAADTEPAANETAESTTQVSDAMNAPPSTSESAAADCVSTKAHPACKDKPCNTEPPPESSMKRFYPLIAEILSSPEVAAINARARAAGRAEIHPAMITSVIAAESSGNPLVTFREKSGRIGKGIGQYTFAEKALQAGLNYNAPKPPSESAAFEAKYNRLESVKLPSGEVRKLYSVWSPKGVIIGMAKDMSAILAKERFIVPRDKSGKVIAGAKPIEVSALYKASATQSMRYLAGHHNRQDMVFQSIEEFYRQHGRLPSEYAQTWGTKRVGKATPKYKLLYQECVNRCYVEKIAGLCGKNAQGFFALYSKRFVRDANGQWKVST